MLSMKAKYAIRALMVLAASNGRTMQAKAIAREADAPAKFLESILLELRNRKLVESKRGIFGGYFLNVPAKNIVLGDIIRQIDGTIAPIYCASVSSYQKCEDCTDENSCAIRHAMIEVRNAVSAVLDRKTLADMVKSQSNQ